MIRPLLALLVLAPLACDYETCDEADASFELPAPGDAVDLTVHACVTHRNGLDLQLSLVTDRPSAEALAVEIDGSSGILHADEDTWGGALDDVADDLDCDPGRRITIRRLDSDDTAAVSGTIHARISAPPSQSCTADITVTPVE